MKHILGILILTLTLISCEVKKSESNFNEIPKKIDLKTFPKEGLITLGKQDLIPNTEGIIADIKLVLAPFEKGVYYRPFSKKLASGNRVEPIWFDRISELNSYKKEKPRFDGFKDLGSFLMLKNASGKYLVLLPVVSNKIGNTFAIYDNEIFLRTATYGTKTEQISAPLLAYAESDNPYEATRKVWELAKNAEGVKGNVNWRSDKTYPEPFKYLGWCSWEHFKKDINEEIILKSISDIKKSEIPFRWVLVDDGYLDQENWKLLSFGTDKNKFPNGWKPITSQKDDKIKWMGIWRNMQGYMQGISPNHTMDHLKDDIVKVKYGKSVKFMPKISEKSADAFYHEMTSVTKKAGFDIIKVDFQSDNYFYNKGSENAIYGVHLNNTALEENCVDENLHLLNCIAQQNFNVFNQRYSSVIRGSVDYKTTMDRTDITIVQNFTNAFWLGHLHWLDQDMFHTSFKETARLMAVSRAMSGGPIYLSDETTNIDDTYLKPLMYKDGEIIRTLAPGVPLPQSMMKDPYFDGKAFSVIAPIENKSAVIMAVNLNQGEKEVKASISLKDYQFAGSMIQPYQGLWNAPKEGIILYDHDAGSASILKDDYQFTLSSRKERLFQLSPIQNGWSVIGNPDKYLSAATYDLLETNKKSLKIKMKEDGPVLLWSNGKIPISENFEFKKLKNGLWQGELVKPNSNSAYLILIEE
ncbi:Raffinose synthase or seed imbibition protein Sip1 [Polaribacter sp. KT25b]|uniref:Sip1-related alpha-galactosidase n=1 Tax=Polaribacter sp. KT25b TaxID=1855336 RepID=UPI00087B1FA2|nr:Sip1-related alpha-galactosidase [Polaribacter sp. KT25b]SDR65382.1 Raffinose synthase or seed imbibition protein Sip1 [Polaribacter sp. KT25b]